MPIRNTMTRTRKLARQEEKADLAIALSLLTEQKNASKPFKFSFRAQI